MGERANFALLPGSIEALKQLKRWGIANIETTMAKRNSILADELRVLGFEIPADSSRGPHFIGAKLPEKAPKDLIKRLELNKIYLSERGGLLRITPNVWNDPPDFEKFLATLSALL